MFTGMIQRLGRVRIFDNTRLIAETTVLWPNDKIQAGESIAVNGCCLTTLRPGTLEFDLSPETIQRTAFSQMVEGDPVNLERAMRPIDRFGGHIVQGHVDAVGELVTVLNDGEFTVFRFRAPAEFDRYLIDKGSITVDGISLTVVNPIAGEFDVWVVPHTLARTNLGAKLPGGLVNLEFDVLAKHVEKLLGKGPMASG